MAEGPRGQRRKQANPRRKRVLKYEPAADAGSETDEDDTAPDLSVEEERAGRGLLGAWPPAVHSLLSHGGQGEEPESWGLGEQRSDDREAESVLAGHEVAQQRLGHGTGLVQFQLKPEPDGVAPHPDTFADFLRRSDTAIIYPEAPEDVTQPGRPEAVGQDDGERDLLTSPDDSAQLLTRPYGDRGYKRRTSLRDHLRFGQQKIQESFTCPLSPQTFQQQAQLEGHMTTHDPPTSQEPPPSSAEGGNRKFKCSECGKAFKYKHHLKEHLRIHSGEKPYECSNCKKRFSHSGSYSSHISSKKCIGFITTNGRVCNGSKNKPGSSPHSSTSSPGSPALSHLRQRLENGRALVAPDQTGQPDIKTEPVDRDEYRLLMASPHGFEGPGIYLNGRRGSPLQIHNSAHIQHFGSLDLSGLSCNLSEVQRVSQILDNIVYRKEMDGNTEEICKLRAYMKDLDAQMEDQKQVQSGFRVVGHSSPTKSITDFTLEKVNEAKHLIDDSKRQKDKLKQSMDLGIKSHNGQSESLLFSCQYCKETFPGPIPLHQHERYQCNMNEEIRAALLPTESVANGCRSSEHPSNKQTTSPINSMNDHLSILKSYCTVSSEPTSEELLKISIAVGLPQELVKDWLAQWKSQNHHEDNLRRKSSPLDSSGRRKHSLGHSPLSPPAVDFPGGLVSDEASHRLTKGNHSTASRRVKEDKPLDLLDFLRSNTLSPINLSSTSSKNSQCSSFTPNSVASEDVHGEVPLDLSLPRHTSQRLTTFGERRPRSNGFFIEHKGEVREQGCGPLDLVNMQGEVPASESGGTSVLHLEKSSSLVFGINPFTGPPVYTSMPPHGAFPPPSFMSPVQATIPGHRPYPSIDPISFLPHMNYTYATGVATLAEMEQRRKYQRKQGFQGEVLDGMADYLSGLDEMNDSESLLCRKKIKKSDSGMYACDLCDKTFQKTSSLLRHKYEHTGKRPHQCQVCKKAFKHKHHLIEHSRLHSGEKPYQCDKCGKRFSHSGSYSQHMNHRYSYCKREAEERQAAQRGPQPGARDGAGEGLEPSELMLRHVYMQELRPLTYSDPEDQRDPDGLIPRNGSGGAGGGRGGGLGQRELVEEETGGLEVSFLEGEGEEQEEEEQEEECGGGSRTQMDRTGDESEGEDRMKVDRTEQDD